jgi:hypothetical protein
MLRDLQRGRKCNFDPRRSMIVYYLQEMGDYYLPVGRDYKPLGLYGYNDWATYDKYSFLFIPKDRITIEAIPFYPNLFLFDDATYPQGKNIQKYLKNIETVFSIKLDPRPWEDY